MKTTDIKLRLLCVLGCWMTLAAGATEAQTKSQVWARIQLLKPRACPYTVQVVVRPAYGSNITFFVGQTVSGAIGGQYSPPPADQLKAREN